MNTENNFCELTLTSKKKYKYDVHDILHKGERDIRHLFKNSRVTMANFEVFEAERERSLQNLRKLTSELQTGRMKIKLHDLCDYFVL
ncbi:hypothetical protein II906_07940 [bacterium]|nr:hypothetical protein [bacterium]